MVVYVIMGNDYPSAVFLSKDSAERHVKERIAQEKLNQAQGRGKIYWRYYEFEAKE